MTEKGRGRRKKTEQKEAVTTDLAALTRRVLLAGIGAAALAHDEAKAFLDRLVERGELAQDQARDLLKEISAKREGRLERVGSRVRARMDRTLSALDVPRQSDLAALQERLDRLTERVEALLEQQKK